MSAGQVERIMLGFACGVGFNYLWWEAWLPGIVVANWIMQAAQIGHARFELREQGQSWREV